MRRILFFAITIIFMLPLKIYSQNLMHAFGTNISVLNGKTGGGTLTMAQTNLSYFPRYNFVENENSSISVGLPLGIGVGIMSNTYGNDAGIAFAYDLPVVLDYNIGCKSTIDNENNFGGYFGLGFGYYKVNISHSSYSDFNGASYGPIARAGVRFSSSNENWYGHGITVGLFYKKGLEKDKFTTIGFNVLLDW